MKKGSLKKYILPNMPYLFMAWACLKLGTAYRLAAGANAGEKLVGMMNTINTAFASPAPGLDPVDWLVGIAGAAVATIGLVTPSIIIILVIASFLNSFRDNKLVDSAFYGLRPASTGLIAAAGLSVVVSNLFFFEGFLSPEIVNWKGWALAVVLWALTNKVKQTKGLHPILFILASAVVGIALGM